MESLVITPSNAAELSFLKELVMRMKMRAHVLTEEEKEDIGLGILMAEADRSEHVSREEIMKKLAP
jgi:hypothetical protein